MNLKQVKDYLDSFINFEKDPKQIPLNGIKLNRVHQLLRLVTTEKLPFKIIHVGGTNGKGSTCAFVSTILAKAGYRVGLYTSPHLIDMKERIRILSKDDLSGEITDEQLCQTLTEIKPSIEKIRASEKGKGLTFFEIWTVLALFYFEKQGVDIAVLEVGMGGRLDATNIVESDVVGMTSIDLEHTHVLGNTLKEIAQEKSAIIKRKNQKVVVAPQEDEVLEVIKRRCNEFGIDPYVTEEISGYNVSLLGRHQRVNAAVALGIIKVLSNYQIIIGDEIIKKGLATTSWPGRFEIVSQNPFVVLDSAHNPSCCQALAQALKETFLNQNIILIIGFSRDKNIPAMCSILNKVSDEIIFTKAGHPRALNPQEYHLADLFSGKKVHVTDNVAEAIRLAQSIVQGHDAIVITGSVFIIGEAKGNLKFKNKSEKLLCR